MKYKIILILLGVILLSGCSGKTTQDNVAQPEKSAETMAQEDVETDYALDGWETEVYDASGQDDLQWGGAIVENSNYVFYTTKTELVQINKNTKEKTVVHEWKKNKDRSISLYCTESELFYIQNYYKIYAINLSDGKRELICTMDVFEKEGYVYPECFGMSVYREQIYLELSGFIIVPYDRNGKIGDVIAQEIDSSAFYGDAFFYRTRHQSDEIHKVDLGTKEDSIVRKGKKDYEYHDIFVVGDNLYYSCEDGIYLYDESGDDTKLIDGGSIVSTNKKDAIYYVGGDEKVYDLCKYNLETKEINKIKICDVKSAEDYIHDERVIFDMLFYHDYSSKKRYKTLDITELDGMANAQVGKIEYSG